MRNQYKKQLYLFIFVLSFISCDKLLEDSAQVSESFTIQRANTLDESSLGQEEANIADYFYDFNDDVYARYSYYSQPYWDQASNTISLPSKLEDKDTLSFRTFPDFLLGVPYEDLEVRTTLFRLNEQNANEENWCDLLLLGNCEKNEGDSIDFNNDSQFIDGDTTYYAYRDTSFIISYKNLDFMKWDSADGRYTTGLSDVISDTIIVKYDITPGSGTDQLDSLVFIGVIDTLYDLGYNPTRKLQYIDRSEWKQYDTTFFTDDVFHELSATFEYRRQVLGLDSLMFRNNGDCDRDGEWDGAEIYYDFGRDFCPDSLETGDGPCTVVDEDNLGEVGYGSFLDEPPCHCLGNWVPQEIMNNEGIIELHWQLDAPVSNNSAWEAATAAINEADCVALDGVWDDPEIPYCLYQQERADLDTPIVCNLECLYDPNGDNWRDCGLDGYCPESIFDQKGNESETERNGIWDAGEAMENNGKYDGAQYKGEYYIDRINNVVDGAEYYYDSNPNDGSDGFAFGDSFEDRNCNGVWDDAETEDIGNGIWDDAEEYIDLNGDGAWNNNEPLYTMNVAPNNYLVDYSSDYSSSSCQESEIFGKCPSPFKKFFHRSKIKESFYDCGMIRCSAGDICENDSGWREDSCDDVECLSLGADGDTNGDGCICCSGDSGVDEDCHDEQLCSCDESLNIDENDYACPTSAFAHGWDPAFGNKEYDEGELYYDCGFGNLGHWICGDDDRWDPAFGNGMYDKVSFQDTTKTDSITIFTHYVQGVPQFEKYHSLLLSITDFTTQKARYPDIEKIVTVYTNVIIDSLLGTTNDYHITKTQWHKPMYENNPATGTIDLVRSYDYDYHIFTKPEAGNIVKMMHPQYFNHYGYYDQFDYQYLGDECTSCLETGLWNHESINEEIYIYAPDGKIRQGEYYYSDKDIVMELAEYRVEEEFEVEFCDGDGVKDDYCSVDNNQVSVDGYGEDEKITIPAIKRVEIYDLIDANTIVCIANNDTISDDAISPELLAVEKCPTDTTIQDIFKVTRIRTLTMLGNGLEFGSRNTIWLAKNLGVVKDKLELRWSAGFWNVDDTGEANQTWKEYSRLELNKLEYQNIDLMRRIMNPIQKVSYDNFEKMESFNNDPYKNNHIFGLHRIHLSND